LFSFTDLATATDAIKKVKNDMSYHSKIAKEIAAEYFDSNKVLSQMLEQLN
jgi:hypothetical protein